MVRSFLCSQRKRWQRTNQKIRTRSSKWRSKNTKHSRLSIKTYNRVSADFSPALPTPPHHRTYGSAYGGSFRTLYPRSDLPLTADVMCN